MINESLHDFILNFIENILVQQNNNYREYCWKTSLTQAAIMNFFLY
jgi:hypothetical protein